MHCRRCQGLMVEEQFFDLEETQGFMWMKGWRCGDCGQAENPLREANRRLNALTQLTLPHTWRPIGSQGGAPSRRARDG